MQVSHQQICAQAAVCAAAAGLCAPAALPGVTAPAGAPSSVSLVLEPQLLPWRI